MSELIDREAVREFIKSYRHSTDVAFDMEDHLDEIPTASPWHRVEDGLPEPLVRCLIWDGYEVDVAYLVRGFYNSKKDWYWRKAGINRKGGKIPHREVKMWMPIEPPKEDA